MTDLNRDTAQRRHLREGQADALEGLLILHYDRLLAYISRILPPDLRSSVDPEDVLQSTWQQVFQKFARFEERGKDSFYRWIATIARFQMLDLIAAHRAEKRGGGRRRVETCRTRDASVQSLLEVLADQRGETPSHVLGVQEATTALKIALAALSSDMRHAIERRYFDLWPAAQIAREMDRTEGAIEQLCHRARRHLRASLGRASQFLSSC